MRITNQAILKGNLGDAPKIIVNNDRTFAVLDIAVSNDYFDKSKGEWIKRDPYWISVYAHGNIAEKSKHLKKGNLVQVEAQLSTTKKEFEGKNINMLVLNARSVDLIQNPIAQDFPESPNFDDNIEVPF